MGTVRRTLGRAYGFALRAVLRPLLHRQREEADRVLALVDGLLRREYRQVEALLGLYSTLAIAEPLPPMRNWAASPDFAVEVARTIRAERPSVVLELGGGVSTLIVAYALRKNGSGRVVSLEHDRAWHSVSSELVARHGLTDWATVVLAPLRDTHIAGEPWRWYDPSALTGLGPLDLVIVDGPPGDTQSLARYPALPLLSDRLQSHTTILLDDADRDDERAIVARWNEEFGPFVIERPVTEKGMAVLRRVQDGA